MKKYIIILSIIFLFIWYGYLSNYNNNSTLANYINVKETDREKSIASYNIKTNEDIKKALQINDIEALNSLYLEFSQQEKLITNLKFLNFFDNFKHNTLNDYPQGKIEDDTEYRTIYLFSNENDYFGKLISTDAKPEEADIKVNSEIDSNSKNNYILVEYQNTFKILEPTDINQLTSTIYLENQNRDLYNMKKYSFKVNQSNSKYIVYNTNYNTFVDIFNLDNTDL